MSNIYFEICKGRPSRYQGGSQRILWTIKVTSFNGVTAPQNGYVVSESLLRQYTFAFVNTLITTSQASLALQLIVQFLQGLIQGGNTDK